MTDNAPVETGEEAAPLVDRDNTRVKSGHELMFMTTEVVTVSHEEYLAEDTIKYDGDTDVILKRPENTTNERCEKK